LRVAVLLCSTLGAVTVRTEPMAGKQEPIPDDVWMEMRGKSWHPNRGCPSRDRLVLLTVPFRDFAGQTKLGQLIVAKSEGPVLAHIFSQIYDSAAFRIERMERVDKYGGDDEASMGGKNTSAVKWRSGGGSSRVLGLAVW